MSSCSHKGPIAGRFCFALLLLIPVSSIPTFVFSLFTNPVSEEDVFSLSSVRKNLNRHLAWWLAFWGLLTLLGHCYHGDHRGFLWRLPWMSVDDRGCPVPT